MYNSASSRPFRCRALRVKIHIYTPAAAITVGVHDFFVHGAPEKLLVFYNGVWFSRDSSPLKHAVCEKEERRNRRNTLFSESISHRRSNYNFTIGSKRMANLGIFVYCSNRRIPLAMRGYVCMVSGVSLFYVYISAALKVFSLLSGYK